MSLQRFDEGRMSAPAPRVHYLDMEMSCSTIAVIDDDEGVRAALRQLLRSMGLAALTFGSAEEFLNARRETDFGCLIADVDLPGMNGVALLRALADAGTALPAILITAHRDACTLALIRQAGSVPYLHKPFSDDQLIDAIRRALVS